MLAFSNRVGSGSEEHFCRVVPEPWQLRHTMSQVRTHVTHNRQVQKRTAAVEHQQCMHEHRRLWRQSSDGGRTRQCQLAGHVFGRAASQRTTTDAEVRSVAGINTIRPKCRKLVFY